jgi:chromosomal replication initiation ATPase DnaA
MSDFNRKRKAMIDAFDSFILAANAYRQEIENAANHVLEVPAKVAAIQRIVSSHYGLHVSAMSVRRRMEFVSGPRQVAMYLVRELTNHSLAETAEHFGRRDHGTVLHAVTRVKDRIATEPGFAAEVGSLRKACETEICEPSARAS